jgi:hypothetical protein
MEHLAQIEEAQTKVLDRVEEAIAKTNELDRKVEKILAQQTEMLKNQRAQATAATARRTRQVA